MDAKQQLNKTRTLIDILQDKIQYILSKEKLSTFDLHQLRIFSELVDSLSGRESNMQSYTIKEIELLIKHSEQLGIKASDIDLDHILKTEKLVLFDDKELTDPKVFTEQRISNTIFTEGVDEQGLTD